VADATRCLSRIFAASSSVRCSLTQGHPAPPGAFEPIHEGQSLLGSTCWVGSGRVLSSEDGSPFTAGKTYAISLSNWGSTR
jgi:hypothetical protein